MPVLTAAQRQRFDDEGYLHLKGVLNTERDLDPIIEEYGMVLDRLAADLFAAGTISSTHAGMAFSPRLIKIYQESHKVHSQFFDLSLPKGGVKADTPMWVGPAVFRALTNPRLLDVVEDIVGPEIYSNPVQHVRIKPPESQINRSESNALVRLTPWHQDNGVVLPEADETQTLTVWFSLTDATVEMGCLQLIPGSHKDGLRTHCPNLKDGLAIPDKLLELDRVTPVPTRRGDVLLLDRRMCHGSLANVSNQVRWSFDLRYNPVGQPSGREAFPGFVARSRSNPASELHDAAAWADLWYRAREMLSQNDIKTFDRWDADAPACA